MSKHLPMVVATVFMILVGSIAVFASTNETTENRNFFTYTVTFDSPPTLKAGRIYMKDTIQLMYGHVILPFKRVYLLLPYGKTLQSIAWDKSGETLLATDYSLKKAQVTLVSAIGKSKGSVEYIRTGTYPKAPVMYDVGIFRGFRILRAYVCPVKFVDGKVYFYQNIKITVTLTDAKIPKTYRGLERDHIEVAMEVANPGVVNTYPVKKLKQDEYRYIIITPQSLANSFQALINHKISRGLTATLITLEDIEANYQGVDTQEKIRNCIIDYYLNHGTEYVLLGGDTTDSSGNDFLPHRATRANVTASNGISVVDIYSSKFPDDLYFSGLDGTWDSDGDGIYGEGDGGSIPEEADWLGEIAVGRAPVDTTAQADTFVNKVIAFESNSRSTTVMLHAEDDPQSFGDMSVIKKNSGGYSVPGVEAYLPSYINVDEMFEAHNTPDITISLYSQHIEQGNLFVNHAGHGDTDKYTIDGSDSTQFSKDDALALQNTVYPIHATVACYSGAFDGLHANQMALLFGGDVDEGASAESDYDCLAEAFIINDQGGMVATMMNSRFGLGDQNDPTLCSGQIDNALYENVFQKGLINLGWAVQKARESVSPVYYNYDVGTYCAYKWTIYDANLLGDPEMPVLDHHAIYGKVVDANGNAVVNATVTLKHVPSGQTFQTTTDANGIFGFDLDELGLSYSNGDSVEITAVNGTQSGSTTIQIDTSVNVQKVIVQIGQTTPEIDAYTVMIFGGVTVLLIAAAVSKEE